MNQTLVDLAYPQGLVPWLILGLAIVNCCTYQAVIGTTVLLIEIF